MANFSLMRCFPVVRSANLLWYNQHVNNVLAIHQLSKEETTCLCLQTSIFHTHFCELGSKVTCNDQRCWILRSMTWRLSRWWVRRGLRLVTWCKGRMLNTHVCFIARTADNRSSLPFRRESWGINYRMSWESWWQWSCWSFLVLLS